MNATVDERNTLLGEARLGVDRAPPASKSHCVWQPVTVDSFGTVAHPACPLQRFGAYPNTARSFVDAFPTKVRIGGQAALADGE